MRTHLSRAPLFLSFVFLLALKPLATAGEPQWVEVRSANFSVVTDAGERRGREVAMRFEQMRAVFGTLMVKAKVNLPVPLQIVAFRNTKEMRQVAPLFRGKPTELAGLFQGGEDRSFIMLDMSVEEPYHTVFHEYAHQLLNGNIGWQPDPWFEEGFAEYFASIEVDSKQARVGKIPEDEYLILQQIGTMKISDLFKVRQNSQTYNESGNHRTTFYAESGMLMHYIYDHQLLPKVALYFDLKDTKHAAVEEAVQQAFGMSPQQLDKALRDYISAGRYRYYPIPNPPNIVESNFKASAMKPTDARAVLADIHLHSPDYRDKARAEFEDILKSEPDNSAACRGLGYAYLQHQEYDKAGEYFKRASELDSKDPRVHYYHAMLMARQSGDGGGADLTAITKELETAISLDPEFADSYAMLAFAQSTGGDRAAAIASMQKALAINPRNESYLVNLANIYLANREPEKAKTVLQSLRTSDNPQLAARIEAMLEQIEEYQSMVEAAATSRTMEVRTESEPHEVVVATAAPPKPVPAKFLKGVLTAVDCGSEPAAVLTILSGSTTWKMTINDRNHVVLIGADEFSCSWKKQKVAVNYRETGTGLGSVISLELQ